MIEIASAERTYESMTGTWRWVCWLEIVENSEVFWLPATAPGELEEAELQAHFGALGAYLWTVAQQKQHQPDVTLHLRERELLRRLVEVILSEINILREVAGLPPRTLKQLKRALKDSR